MFLQIAGSICIVTATTLFGFCAAKTSKYRGEDLEELEKALTLLKNEISFSLRPLPEALLSVADHRSGVVAAFFAEASRQMATGTAASAFQIWEDAAVSILPVSYLNGEDLDSLLSFGRTLGYGDKTQQIAAADIAIASLRQHREEARAAYAKNAKLCQSLGVLSGILLAVVLL